MIHEWKHMQQIYWRSIFPITFFDSHSIKPRHRQTASSSFRFSKESNKINNILWVFTSCVCSVSPFSQRRRRVLCTKQCEDEPYVRTCVCVCSCACGDFNRLIDNNNIEWHRSVTALTTRMDTVFECVFFVR